MLTLATLTKYNGMEGVILLEPPPIEWYEDMHDSKDWGDGVSLYVWEMAMSYQGMRYV